MDIEYTDPDIGKELAEDVKEFINEEVIPKEKEILFSGETPGEDELIKEVRELHEEARKRDIYGPQIPEEYGGQGLEFREVLPVFEEAGKSLLGASAIRADAPDEGNIHLLEMAGNEEQKEKWMKPLADAEIQSGFAMTEPMQGAGSDPKMVKTTAEKDGDQWILNGHKWWTTNGSQADFFIVMARTDWDAHPYQGCSMFLVPADKDGIEIVRDIPHMGRLGSVHSEIKFNDVRVPEENLLGQKNQGFMLAQMRLGPARLTHCMRFSGMAERALEIGCAYIDEREGFGEDLSSKQALRFEVAERYTELHAARTMVRHAADLLNRGEQARLELHMCKAYTANVVQDAIDTAVQMCGGNGIGRDLPLADFYEAVRSFRIVDGADEVHKRSIARRAFDDLDKSELDNVTRFDG